MCGENGWRASDRDELMGSPPRVRGKRKSINIFRAHTGITPACAGKTKTMRRTDDYPEDHPRVCGENRLVYGIERFLKGSPPRVRGKLDQSPGKPD